MGKTKRSKQKMHISSIQDQQTKYSTTTNDSLEHGIPLRMPHSENPFAGMQIDIGRLSNMKDDVASMKSYKSAKSAMGVNKALSQREKRKLKRDVLLKKIDIVNQIKKEEKMRKKRKKITLVGDINPLLDALPDLSSLLKSKNYTKVEQSATAKGAKLKSIPKESRRRKNYVEGINLFKTVYKQKYLKKNIDKVSESLELINVGNRRK